MFTRVVQSGARRAEKHGVASPRRLDSEIDDVSTWQQQRLCVDECVQLSARSAHLQQVIVGEILSRV